VLAALLGPTASAKSAIGLRLARRFGAEIVSVDSMQVYRGMDIGTAKPTPAERAEIRHHLVDVADPEESFTVARFQHEGRAVMAAAAAAGRRLLIVGGSGLHFRALVDPLEFPPSDPAVRAELEALAPDVAVARLEAADPAAREWTDLANPRRVVRALEILALTGQTPAARAAAPAAVAVRAYAARFPLVVIGVDPGPGLGDRVRRRFDAMLAAGLVAEVEALAPRLGVTAAQAVGYREILRVVRKEWSLEDAVRRAVDATTSLARRQRTFHRRDPRVRWLRWDDDDAVMTTDAVAVLEEAGWTS
jgi:tRNA dimethylallyltransferase